MGAVISAERKKQMIPYIQSNFNKLSQREIARRLGIGKTTVNKWSFEIDLKHRKHTVNEKFFNKWNEEVAYILGFIFADGNISWNPKKGYQSLTITAAAKDKDHLEKIRQLLSNTKPLLYASKTNSYRFIASNRNLCKKLMSLGVIPRKSLTVRFPEAPSQYLRHFIRGVIDGDGTVRYVNRSRSSYFVIQIASGSQNFLKKFIKIIKASVGIEATLLRKGKNVFVVQYSCSRGMKLANWIYKDSGIFLNRKFEQYEIALNKVKPIETVLNFRLNGGGNVP